MGDVVQAEIVQPAPRPLARVTEVLTAPYTGTRLRNAIVREIDQRMESGDYAFTLSTIARRNGMVPTDFVGLLHKAFNSPTHELHDFAVEMQKRWALCEEHLYGEMLSTGAAKGKWEAFATGLERTRPDDWRRPSQKEPANQTLNIGVVEKLALLAGGRDQLTTGD